MFGCLKRKIDPEIEKIFKRLDDQLQTTEDWRISEGGKVTHKSFNLSISRDCIIRPDSLRIPGRWKSKIKKHIRNIYRIEEINKLHFIYDVIDGKYPYYIDSYQTSSELFDWFKENAKEDQYMIIQYSPKSQNKAGLYIKDLELAMGYKLTFKN